MDLNWWQASQSHPLVVGLLDLEEGKTIVTKLFFFPLAVKLNIYIYRERERENKILWII